MLIAFGHQAGVGKDEACTYLWREHGFLIESFAGSLKKAARTIFKLSQDQVYGSLKEMVDPRWGMTPREILQRFGTDAMRGTFGPDVWVNSLRLSVSEMLDDGVDIAISDCRFLSEAQAVKNMGGYVVKVNRPSRKLPSKPDHPSETELADYTGWDAVIDNVGSLEQFTARIEELYRSLRERQG